MATLMKQRRQVRALDRMGISPYNLPKNPTKEQIKRADRLAGERLVLIKSTQNIEVSGLSHRLNRAV